MKNNLFRLCLIINSIYFLFGFFIITSEIGKSTTVLIQDKAALPDLTITFSFDTNNIILVVIATIILIAIVGINIFGTGFQDSSIKLIYKALSYMFLWVILSIFSIDMFSIIPVLGDTLYILFTFVYGLSFLLHGAETEI